MINVANPIYDAVFKYLMEDTRVAKTLLSAASDAKVRQDMNVEEEYFQAIENRDTAIMLRDQKIAERDAQLAEKDGQLVEKDGQLAEKDKALIGYAKALYGMGKSYEEIAESTTLPIELLKEVL